MGQLAEKLRLDMEELLDTGDTAHEDMQGWSPPGLDGMAEPLVAHHHHTAAAVSEPNAADARRVAAGSQVPLPLAGQLQHDLGQ